MKRMIMAVSIAVILSGCASVQKTSVYDKGREPFFKSEKTEYDNARGGGAIIRTAEKIALVEKKIIRGSCWDFVNHIYNEAGYSGDRRHTVFLSKSTGPYADTDLLRAGDWVMIINYEFNDSVHSAIFARWIDRSRNLASTIDYAGMNRSEPGKYREHNLSKVYGIIRPGAKIDK